MILMYDETANRSPFSRADAKEIADYLIIRSHPITADILAGFLEAKYEQGVRDCTDGIITSDMLHQQHVKAAKRIMG